MNRPNIFDAIDENGIDDVKRFLCANPSLAISGAARPKLYKTNILHWLYVGDTPMHLAAAGYRIEIVKLLLDVGADPNSAANHRRSGPLHYAADTCFTSPSWNARNQVETIRCLLDAGAKINAQDKNGATPLHRSVRTRGADAVRCLLESGADPLIKNKPGSTPFHLAVRNTGRGGSGTDAAKEGQRQIIKTFLAFGLSPMLRDGNGKTVLDWAKSESIREFLNKSHGV